MKHELLDKDIKELLEEIKGWMMDNDYECGEQGSELYERIDEILKRNI